VGAAKKHHQVVKVLSSKGVKEVKDKNLFP
jgi:hypothetical protein